MCQFLETENLRHVLKETLAYRSVVLKLCLVAALASTNTVGPQDGSLEISPERGHRHLLSTLRKVSTGSKRFSSLTIKVQT